MTDADVTFSSVDPRLRDHWHPVARVQDVGDTPSSATLLGHRLVLVRLGDKVLAFHDACPHRGASLSAGRIVGVSLQCPYHGLRIDPDGEIRTPSNRLIEDLRHPPLETFVRHGLVWVRLNPSEAAIPEFGAWGGKQYRSIALPPSDWHSSAAQMVDNFLDVSHFPYVHGESFGVNGDNTALENIKIEPEPFGFTFEIEHWGRRIIGASGKNDDPTAVRRRRLQYQYHLPFNYIHTHSVRWHQ